MSNLEKIETDVLGAIRAVIDPETGADVLRMRLVIDLTIHPNGTAEYTFRPSSPLCPIALPLVISIIEAVKAVDGVMDQIVTVVDYAGADELNQILRSFPLAKQKPDQ